MQTTLPLLHRLGVNLGQMWSGPLRQIELQGSPQVPQGEWGEWTPRDIEIDVERIFVSLYRFPVMFARTFGQDSLAVRLKHSEYWLESFVGACQSGKPPI
jgi:hypothetical protein